MSEPKDPPTAGPAQKGSILPFSAGVPAPKRGYDPVAALYARQRMREQIQPQPPAPAAPPNKPRAPAQERLEALRNGEIVNIGIEGGAILDQAVAGAITVPEAFRRFNNRIAASPVSLDAKHKLGTYFTDGLKKRMSARPQRPPRPAPVRQAAAPQRQLPASETTTPATPPRIDVARDGKSDRLTRGGNFLKKLADMAGEVRELLNHDPGSGRTPLDAMRLFGFIADDLTRRGLEQIPVVGEQMVQGRQDINDAVSEVFEQASQASRTRLQELGRREKLSDRDIDNLGFLGEMLPDVLGIVPGGPGHRRGRGRGPDGIDNGRPNDPADKSTLSTPQERSPATASSKVERASTALHELDLSDDVLEQVRKSYGIEQMHTSAVAKTDIPGLDAEILEGFSTIPRRKARPEEPTLDQAHGTDRRIRSPFKDPRYKNHAEEDLFDLLDNRLQEARLSSETLEGKTISILISNPLGVCDRCLAGVPGLSTRPGIGILRQFSKHYPELTIRFRAAKGHDAVLGKAKILNIRDGKWKQ